MARKMLVDGEAPVADGGQYDYDLFVIGAGSGGVRGSRTAASFGAKVGYSSVDSIDTCDAKTIHAARSSQLRRPPSIDYSLEHVVLVY